MVNQNISLILLFSTVFFLSDSALSYEMHFGAGLNYYSVRYDTGDVDYDSNRDTGTGYHFNWGVQKSFGDGKRHFIGTGLDIDNIADNRVMGFRAIDYQYALGENWRVGAFVGAASMDSGLPQNGYYFGANSERMNLFDSISVKAELRYGSGLARDRLLESDPQGTRPDIFTRYYSFAVTFNYRL